MNPKMSVEITDTSPPRRVINNTTATSKALTIKEFNSGTKGEASTPHKV